MPSASEHEEQAASNEDHYRELGGDAAVRSDWAMTVLYYAAVQHIQALIVRKGWKVKYKGKLRFPAEHGERLQVIHRECQQIEADFRTLKGWSEDARYECEKFDGKLAFARAALESIKAEIAAIS